MAIYLDLVVTVDLHIPESGHLAHLPILLLLFQETLEDLFFVFFELKQWTCFFILEMPFLNFDVPVLE